MDITLDEWQRFQLCAHRVSKNPDMFPPAYHESVDLLEDHMRRTMASYNDALDSFIEADAYEDGNGGYIPCRLERLRLEFFDPDEPVTRRVGPVQRSPAQLERAKRKVKPNPLVRGPEWTE